MNDSTSDAPEGRQSWWQRLRGGLSRTSSAITTAITDLITKRKLDAGVIAELEDLLIRTDIGVDFQSELVGDSDFLDGDTHLRFSRGAFHIQLDVVWRKYEKLQNSCA